jgi:polysaccharide export outer membrane protein
MKKLVPLLLSLFVLSGCASKELKLRQQMARANARDAMAGNNENVYRAAPGDGLLVEFYYNEELNRGVLVRPDGFISLPLIDDVKVADLTLAEIRKTLSEKYTGILKTPKVAVSLENLASFKIFVGGEVSNPGVFALSDGITLLRAIAMAGGAKQTAGLGSVLVIRDQGTPQPEYLMVDLKAGTEELLAGNDLQLRPKDMVVVPKSKIAKADQVVDQYLNQLIPFQKSLSATYVFGRPTY